MNDLVRSSQELTMPTGELLPLIQPIGCAGSDMSNVKPHGNRLTKGEPMLFIGGPLDGNVLRVPADGRMYEHIVGFDTFFRYMPAIISFDGQRRMVYILGERIKPEEKPALEYTQVNGLAREQIARSLGVPAKYIGDGR
jgi:hypothetical protein